jgi:hypothetical protein
MQAEPVIPLATRAPPLPEPDRPSTADFLFVLWRIYKIFS